MRLVLVLGFLASATLAHARTVQNYCDPALKSQSVPVIATAGDDVLIFAAGNPSTGYGWYSKDGLRSVYNPSTPTRPGSAGVFEFRFKAASDQNGRILTFEYTRPWLKDPVATCRVLVTVK